jgi:hypothetical protein
MGIKNIINSLAKYFGSLNIIAKNNNAIRPKDSASEETNEAIVIDNKKLEK